MAEERTASNRPPPGAGLPLRNIVLFALVCLFSVAFAAAYIVRAASGSSGPPRDPAFDAPQLALADVLTATQSLIFLDTTDIADPNRAIARLPGDPAAGGRQASGELCQRVAMAAGRGLCLTLGHDLSRGSAFIFDSAYSVVHVVPASGLPSRARVSPDGRYGSMTFFIFGHSYSGDTLPFE